LQISQQDELPGLLYLLNASSVVLASSSRRSADFSAAVGLHNQWPWWSAVNTNSILLPTRCLVAHG